MTEETIYTVQVFAKISGWHDIHVFPHHDTLVEARKRLERRREKARLRFPDSKYRILKVTRTVVEGDE